MQRVLGLVSFLMFFPVGCSIINDFSADMLEHFRRSSVSEDAIPASFPVIALHRQPPEVDDALSPSMPTPISTTDTIDSTRTTDTTLSQAHNPEDKTAEPNNKQSATPTVPLAFLTRFEALQNDASLPHPLTFNFDREQINSIRISILNHIRREHEDYLQSLPLDAAGEALPPWRLYSLDVIEAFDNGKMHLKVSALSQEGQLHIGWYESTDQQWQPRYFLQRKNISPKLQVLPFSIAVTLMLWLWHRKRLRRMAEWKKNHTQAEKNDQQSVTD